MKYIRPLDGIRAVAALMVVCFHSPVPLFQFRFGWAGVNLFFILSGFLITRILLAARPAPFAVYLKKFYARRALRIIPLYLFYLLICTAIVSLPDSRGTPVLSQAAADLQANYPFLLTFTYNFEEIIHFINGTDYHNSMFFGHLWTLSVEWQFYLLFPLLIYFRPLDRVKDLMVFFVFLIPMLRMLSVYFLQQRSTDLFWIGDILYVSTPFQIDTLCMGAMLAMFEFKDIAIYGKQLFGGLAVLIILIGYWHMHTFKKYGLDMEPMSLGFDAPVFHVFVRTPNTLLNNRYLYSIPLLNLFFSLLVLLAIRGIAFSTFFSNGLLVYIGKISYGVYIYHLAFAWFFEDLFRRFFHKNIEIVSYTGQVATMLVYVALLIGIASLSYYFLERPFLKKKQGLV